MAVLACLVVAGLLLAHGIAGVDVCSRTLFSCSPDENPCDPEWCVTGQLNYPGLTPWKYVYCDLTAPRWDQCVEKSCHSQTQVYDPESTEQLKCGDKPAPQNVTGEWGYTAPPSGLFDLSDRCYNTDYVLGNKYNCRRHNPCITPRCMPGVAYYPGRNDHTYVYCNDTASTTVCQEERCPDYYHKFDVSSQSCVMDINRCNGETYNCKERNPCLYPSCGSGPNGRRRFPFNSRNRKYVMCDADECSVERCGSGTLYDRNQQDCLEPSN